MPFKGLWLRKKMCIFALQLYDYFIIPKYGLLASIMLFYLPLVARSERQWDKNQQELISFLSYSGPLHVGNGCLWQSSPAVPHRIALLSVIEREIMISYINEILVRKLSCNLCTFNWLTGKSVTVLSQFSCYLTFLMTSLF